MKNLFRLAAFFGLLVFANREWNKRFAEAALTDAFVEDRQGKQFAGKRVRVGSIFDAPPERVWRALQKKEALMYVSKPLLTFRPVADEPLPDSWGEGDSLTFDLYTLGAIPVGSHTINVLTIDDEGRYMSTQEHGGAAQVWNHQIWVEEVANGRSRYTDQVDIYAGPLTPLIAAFAYFFYRWRQTRWPAVLSP